MQIIPYHLAINRKKFLYFGVTSYAWITGGTGSGSVNNRHTVSLLEGLNTAGYKLDKELVELYNPPLKKKRRQKKKEEKPGEF
ncbi:hypothetical protein LIV57_17955 [Chryseobacterium sp. X308]|uniref:hypothetical protein n=1 Tax=Chryseobacterium sp. X308 TaxID=2884873 RepID=UPI001D142AC6|nr:hypothetical protein [Chryseobacterium sp. X308]MCC3217156.1 hypothetical protein [Chryseobacterium sp. X308]